MNITIDPDSGFCFGVEHAVDLAEKELEDQGKLYCLGDIVHNTAEAARLEKKGLVIIGHDEFRKLSDCRVLIRAHGEPPETYRIAAANNITLIDASCPVVLHLQHRIKEAYRDMQEKNGQVVIYGKKGHAEVNGLNGQTNDTAVIISSKDEIVRIDLSRPLRLFAQTTMSPGGFQEIVAGISEKMNRAPGEKPDFEWKDSICRKVAGRSKKIRTFAPRFDVVIFVSGKESSNGRHLFEICRSVNPNTWFVSGTDELQKDWFVAAANVGISGATSTPLRQMEEIREAIIKITG
jgi:4-hydroxy-3-methylbut-2-en-1-yl diphosphate reductase